MSTFLPRSALIVCAVAGLACSLTVDPVEEQAMFTSLRVEPAGASLYLLPPGNTVQLAVTAEDQDGRLLPVAGAMYSTSDGEIVQVSNTGEVKSVGLGRAEVAVRVTIAGVSQTAGIYVFVIPRPDPVTAHSDAALSTVRDLEAQPSRHVR